MNDNDALDLQKHRAREVLIGQYRSTFGLTRKSAHEDFIAHIENDEASPVYCTAAGKPRKRARRVPQEASA